MSFETEAIPLKCNTRFQANDVEGTVLMRDYYIDLSILISLNMDTTALQTVKIP